MQEKMVSSVQGRLIKQYEAGLKDKSRECERLRAQVGELMGRRGKSVGAVAERRQEREGGGGRGEKGMGEGRGKRNGGGSATGRGGGDSESVIKVGDHVMSAVAAWAVEGGGGARTDNRVGDADAGQGRKAETRTDNRSGGGRGVRGRKYDSRFEVGSSDDDEGGEKKVGSGTRLGNDRRRTDDRMSTDDDDDDDDDDSEECEVIDRARKAGGAQAAKGASRGGVVAGGANRKDKRSQDARGRLDEGGAKEGKKPGGLADTSDWC